MLLLALLPLCAAIALVAGDCPPDKLTAYRVVLRTFWTRDAFPKHYPEWRPPAQWSKLIGKTHDPNYTLFRLGQKASAGAKALAEVGRGDLLEAAGPVYDEFVAPAITAGAGRTEAQFFVDGNHSRVSLMSRIIPSPDWFIGLDSFDLCVDGNWIDTITIEADPLDAGTDNGFTFTAPNWATSPQGVIYRITSRYPSHPAGSFYYPYLKRLPPIATFQFIKTREYELNEVFHHSEDDKRYDVVSAADQSNSISVLGGVPLPPSADDQDEQLELEAERREQELRLHQQLATRNTIARTNAFIRHSRRNRGKGLRRRQRLRLPATWSTAVPPPPGAVPRGDAGALLNSIVQVYHDKQSHKPRKSRKYRGSRDCRVGEWGAWGGCSKTCGVGEMVRRREVARQPRRGGRPCAPLVESKWCGGGAAGCDKIDW